MTGYGQDARLGNWQVCRHVCFAERDFVCSYVWVWGCVCVRTREVERRDVLYAPGPNEENKGEQANGSRL